MCEKLRSGSRWRDRFPTALNDKSTDGHDGRWYRVAVQSHTGQGVCAGWLAGGARVLQECYEPVRTRSSKRHAKCHSCTILLALHPKVPGNAVCKLTPPRDQSSDRRAQRVCVLLLLLMEDESKKVVFQLPRRESMNKANDERKREFNDYCCRLLVEVD